MGEVLERRRTITRERSSKIQSLLKQSAEIAGGKGCIYVTGSFGRGEASEFSDLDLFILGRTVHDGNRALRHLDEICITAELVHATRELKIPEFSGDGEYLAHYTIDELVKTLGTSKDDSTNTFTARLLLLLESQPLIGNRVYAQAIDKVIKAYWRDFKDHQRDFIPAFLTNDILRLWRTFCVNYEASTRTDSRKEKAKRKLKNYKLKHSRLLTCYSAIIYLLTILKTYKTVTPDNVHQMVKLTPTQRLEWLLQEDRYRSAYRKIKKLIACYEQFLEKSEAKKEDLIKQFLDKRKSRQLFIEASEFGNLVFDVLNSIGKDEHFFRLLLV